MTHFREPTSRRPAPPHARLVRGASRCLACLAALAAAGHAAAQDAGDPLQSLPAQVRVGIERTTLPGDEHMGLVGTSYMVDVWKGVRFGPSVYGAVSGKRGGLFTVGAELGWQGRVAGPLTLDVGFYAGGGGGGSAPVGGGMMLRPHADLLWDFGPFLAGISASRVRYANGDIDSKQLGLVFSAKSNFRFVPRHRIGEKSDIAGRSGMGFDRFQGVVGVYKPRPGVTKASGAPHTLDVGIVGARFERAFDDHAYWGIEASGAASGGVGGYAEFLGTLGRETTVWPNVLTLGGRLAVGMGGGGDVGVGGGLLLKGGLYGTVRLNRQLGLTLEGGMTRAPQGRFKAYHGMASLSWILDDPSALTAPPRNTRTEWIGGAEQFRAQRRSGVTRAMQAVTLKTNRFVTEHVYLTGQAHSAWGGGAGGYTAGFIGVGVQAPIWGRVHAGAEALVGAAGGGGVETHGGAVQQPNAYVGVDLGRGIALRVGRGKIKSLREGGLNATTNEIMLSFTFAAAGHGYR